MPDSDLPSVFEELVKFLPNMVDPFRDPEQCVLDIHKRWKEAGGSLNGKPRHSDRYLDDALRASGVTMRSLTPKLLGKTRLRGEDGHNLSRFFLSNWPVVEDDAASNTKHIRYRTLLSRSEIGEIASYLGLHIEQTHIESARDFTPGVKSAAVDVLSTLPGRDLSELIPALFRECDAFCTVATDRATVPQADETVLLGFNRLMTSFYDIEQETDRNRPLIWVIDLGKRTFESLDDRLKYIGFSRLQMRFKSIRDFQHSRKKITWDWLTTRAIFVVLDSLYQEESPFRGIKRPDFFPHHISLNTIAPEWAASPNFRTLYGKELEDIRQRSFSVFFNVDGWPYDGEMVTEDVQHCRFFGYAGFSKDSKPTTEKLPRGLELPFMNSSYEEAFKTIYAASTQILGLENRLPAMGTDAPAELRSLGFRLLSLEEFMNL